MLLSWLRRSEGNSRRVRGPNARTRGATGILYPLLLTFLVTTTAPLTLLAGAFVLAKPYDDKQ